MPKKHKITFEKFVESVFDEINKIYDYDFNETLIPEWTETYASNIRASYESGEKPYDAAVNLLDEATPAWQNEVYGA